MEEKDLNQLESDVTEEKDTTSELREAYEEASAAQPPKKKRKISKKQIVLMCIAGFILLVGVAVGLFFLIGTLTAKDITVVKGEFHNVQPDVAMTFEGTEVNQIELVMAGDADEATIKKTIAMMYQKANYNKIHNTDQAITILQGQGWADAFGAVGSMAVRGFKVQAGSEFYYQKAAPIVECDPVALHGTLQSALQQQERVYTNGVDDFRLTGTLKGGEALVLLDDEDHPMTKTLPFVTVGVPKKSKIQKKKSFAEFKEAGFYLEDTREITNFKITEDTIVLNPLDEGKEYIEKYQTESGDVYYVCRFSLLISGDNRDECVHYAREYLRKSAKSDDLEYLQFDITLEVWENGYFKMMHDEERWEGTATAGAKTTSKSWYESITYYNFDSELFNEADAAEYKGDDWAAKIIAHYKAELDNA